MILESSPAWPSLLLAAILLGDAALSLKPVPFIEAASAASNSPRTGGGRSLSSSVSPPQDSLPASGSPA